MVKLPNKPRRRRRALTHAGGPIELKTDDGRLAEIVRAALDVRPDETETMSHVHGFHSYPARLHPRTARALVDGLSQLGDKVLDPFCGSGTVVVEARLAGRRAHGCDVNPLAVRLAELKARGASATEATRLVDLAHRVAEHAEDRRVRRAGPTRPYGPADRELFDVHVLLELDGLMDGIGRVRSAARRPLKLVFSSILTKVSRRVGDSAARTEPKRLAAGFAVRLFVDKAEDLARRLADFSARLPRSASPARLAVDDARDLSIVRAASMHLVVTSPPYPGVYDYFDHHAARLRWLDLDDREFESREIGSRRHLASLSDRDAAAEWRGDLRRVLERVARCLAPGGHAAIVMADSAVGRLALSADALLAELALDVGLEVVARGSQTRGHFHSPTRAAFHGRPRREHLMILRCGDPPEGRTAGGRTERRGTTGRRRASRRE